VPPTPQPAGALPAFYGMLLRACPDATVEINEQLGEGTWWRLARRCVAPTVGRF